MCCLLFYQRVIIKVHIKRNHVLMFRNNDSPALVCLETRVGLVFLFEIVCGASLAWLVSYEICPTALGLKNVFEVLISSYCNLHSNKAFQNKRSQNYSILTSLREAINSLKCTTHTHTHTHMCMPLNELRSESIAVFVQMWRGSLCACILSLYLSYTIREIWCCLTELITHISIMCFVCSGRVRNQCKY